MTGDNEPEGDGPSATGAWRRGGRARDGGGPASPDKFTGAFLILAAALFIDRMRRRIKEAAARIADVGGTLAAGILSPAKSAAEVSAGMPAAGAHTASALAAIVEVRNPIRPELGPGDVAELIPKLVLRLAVVAAVAGAGYALYSMQLRQMRPW